MSTMPRLVSPLAASLFALILIATPAASAARRPAPAQTTAAQTSPAQTTVAELLALQQADQRVADIAWRLAAGGGELCRQQNAALGITLHDAAQYTAEVRAAAQQAFGFSGSSPSVLAVAKGSPAALAGVRPNDVLLAVGGVEIGGTLPDPASSTARMARYDPINHAMRALEDLPAGLAVHVSLLRKKQNLSIFILPRTVCRSRVELAPGPAVQANANGLVAQVSGGMVEWAASDDELALVIGHEMAHNLLGHQDRITQGKLTRGLLRGYGRRGRELRDMERAADRLGTQLAARAGYAYRLAPQFWERLSRRAGLGALWATTHPSAANRREHLEAVVREIDQGTL
ncbi:MAG: hypothetical protein RL268_227 [Pseudomonadota bacterium]|jgi:hypothetical protein